jgi:tetratricopeptide (TPR) repeat protein
MLKNNFFLQRSFLIMALLSLFVFSASAQLRPLTIVTEPNASVWIDDVFYGKTNETGKLQLKTFMTGIRRLRVRADGFRETVQTLLPTQKGEIKINLVKTNDPAELAFQQAEAMALVDRDKALELYEKAVKLRPKYAEAYLGQARLLLAMGELDNALEAIRKARQAKPNYAEASAVEGRIHKESGDEAKAIASFKRAVTEGRGIQPEALSGLGLLYKEKAGGFAAEGDFDNEKEYYLMAARELRKAVTQLAGAPDAITIYQFLGDCYEKAGMPQEAIKIYEEVLKNFPDINEATMFRSFIVQLKKQLEEKP